MLCSSSPMACSLLYDSTSCGKSQSYATWISALTKEWMTNIRYHNQVDCQSLHLKNDWMIPDVVGDIAVHLVECNCRWRAGSVAPYDEKILQLQDPRLGSILGLFGHAIDVVYPSCPKSPSKCFGSSLRESQPKPAYVGKYEVIITDGMFATYCLMISPPTHSSFGRG